jgi:hypothetical protein
VFLAEKHASDVGWSVRPVKQRSAWLGFATGASGASGRGATGR